MEFLPNEITKELVLKAIERIEQEKLVLIPSTRWLVEINGKTYPSKEVMRYAHEQLNGQRIWNYGGGNATNKYFNNMGFPIIDKSSDPVLDLIRKYKEHIHNGGLDEEIYKWELLQRFKGRPNVQALNFYEEIKSINFSNLIYPIGLGVINHIAKDRPEAFRGCFSKLFDESRLLSDRIKDFSDETLALYRDMGQKLPHHQDERTISTFLTYYSPNEYTFYKDSFYQKYCKLIGITPRKKGEKYVHYLELINDFIDDYINEDDELKKLISNRSERELFDDKEFKVLAQDILYQTLDKLSKQEESHGKIKVNSTTENGSPGFALNQILFGPPGTGKTYSTIAKSLEILGVKVEGQSRDKLTKLFSDKVKDGQIVFTTFHQSMTYEDFIEGIKPAKPDDGDTFLKYEIKPGIFKNICDLAKTLPHIDIKVNWDDPRYFKMSLGGKERQELHDWCINNNLIAIGWGGSSDLSKFKSLTKWSTYRDTFNKDFPNLVSESRYNIQATYAFLHMSVNDIVVISRGNHVIDAVGIIKSEYFFDDSKGVDFCHFREVEWLAKDLKTSPERFFRKQISQQSIYEFDNVDIKKDSFKELTGQLRPSDQKNYVLIIDEINRGNVSQIFGELITLIEEDKRLGREEELRLILPYSKESFGVPSNLYIIGTMNTADRSVEALDTALRRRFNFEEMQPKPELLNPHTMLYKLLVQYEGLRWEDPKWKQIENNFFILYDAEKVDENQYTLIGNTPASFNPDDLNGVIQFNDFNLQTLLTTINKRIEKLLDRDHQIGHSYFMSVYSLMDLKQVFKNKIIPLLQEYFFGDYGKIGLVLGAGFLESDEDKDQNYFADFPDAEYTDFSEKKCYRIPDTIAMTDQNFKRAIRTLMKL